MYVEQFFTKVFIWQVQFVRLYKSTILPWQVFFVDLTDGLNFTLLFLFKTSALAEKLACQLALVVESIGKVARAGKQIFPWKSLSQ